ncbi:PREDICTED: ankyrin repeat domain-containing protein 39-like isoform X2 [Polistes canadensis]|uniref:ankyrin repeat domain-containing protein 39-like isoform X2 n=1 Tax=Polistes canadensis TaxID=91411 RepID=UPI000718C36F|nr:PREDICTED: ankyrin repeat domain-containing protein 39-like isoform X2 [Polistes canadensis]
MNLLTSRSAISVKMERSGNEKQQIKENMAKESKHEKGVKSCCDLSVNLGVCQSLPEIEFERGIWYAAQYNDKDKVEGFLRKEISVDIEDSAGYTALHYAARNGHYQICEMLLKYGANVNAKTRCGQATALHRAATQGHDHVVEILLKYGANANLKDADEYTALHRAIIAARVSICQILIPHSDLSIVDKKNRTAKQLANEYCNDVLSLLSS